MILVTIVILNAFLRPTGINVLVRLLVSLVVARAIITLKEYDLEHKNNIYVRTSCRSLAVLPIPINYSFINL